jgi:gliding motility-associated lipoprotein GldH
MNRGITGEKRKREEIMMKKRVRNNNYLIFTLLIILVSCMGGSVYHENLSLKAGKWNAGDSLVFNALIKDTLQPHAIYISLRNKGSYGFSNFYAFITTHAPSGSSRTDTFEFALADRRGKWLGHGFGDLWQSTRPFKIGIRFPHTGIYTFIVKQGMRVENLEGIMDFGIRIERKNP